MNRNTQSEEVQQILFLLKYHGWHGEVSAREVARRMNASNVHTVRGKQWTAANLRAFARRHSFSRNFMEYNLRKMSEGWVVTVDDPALFEVASADIAGWLAVTGGLSHPRLISRIIEKGSRAQQKRLRRAIAEDPEVRSEVLRFVPLALEQDHPWAAETYREFLEYAYAVVQFARNGCAPQQSSGRM